MSGLTGAEIEQFLSDGYVVVPGAIDPAFLEEKVQHGFRRLGIREDDPSTWSVRRTHMPVTEGFPLPEYAPRAWRVLCDLLGGEERIRQPAVFCDNLILVLPGEGRAWAPPDEDRGSWHKDGDWFLHFLDSPEQAILGVIFWRDVLPRGGGTYFAADSVGPVARFLLEHPEGVEPLDFDFGALRDECGDLRELTGSAGDVVWLHPYMLHSLSSNTLDQPRVISNLTASLRAPMRFDPDVCPLSVVERATLRALGVERLDFTATGERRRIVPDREAEWERERKLQEERLARSPTETDAR